MISRQELRKVLAYDETNGTLKWAAFGKKREIGAVAGHVAKDGYRRICINYRMYLAHRLVWLLKTGTWPTVLVDHANMNKDDNRWWNLREATHSQNKANRLKQANNSSGIKGVDVRGDKWRARIRILGKEVHLGIYATKEAAHAAYVKAANRAFGEFARVE